MTWIYLAIIAQFINAIVVLTDRYIVTSRAVPRPVTYAFYVSILSGVVVVLIPFREVISFSWPVIGLSIATGFTYVISLIFLYSALRTSDASDVAPVMGAITSIATLGASVAILHESIPRNMAIDFLLLVLGTVFLSYFRFSRKTTFFVVGAGILFGLSTVLTKAIFNITNFGNGFFWSRLGNVFIALVLLLWPGVYKSIRENMSQSAGKTSFLVLANKTLAGVAFLLFLVALKLGNPPIVNALMGAQFIFLLLFALLAHKRMGVFFNEHVHRPGAVAQKVVGITLIVIGLIGLFL